MADVVDALPHFRKAPLEPFHALGESIEEKFSSQDLEDGAFARLAADFLERFELGDTIFFEDIADYLMGAECPRQNNSFFSDLPVVVYRGRSFYIELLFWVQASARIHTHAFAGAFRVLSGGSLHARYRFLSDTAVGNQMRVGKVEFVEAECLAVGDTRMIDPGLTGLVHSLYHLESPSISLVVRTPSEPRHGIQFGLFPPGIALDTVALSRDVYLSSIERLMRLADQSKSGSGKRLVSARVDQLGTAQVAYLALKRLGCLGTDDELHELLANRSRRHRDHAQLIADASRHERVARAIGDARAATSDSDLRFFLALLLNMPSRDALMSMVSERYPATSPYELCARWLLALASHKVDLKSRLAKSLASWDSDAWRVGATVGAALQSLTAKPDAEQRLALALTSNVGASHDGVSASTDAFAALRKVPELATLFG